MKAHCRAGKFSRSLRRLTTQMQGGQCAICRVDLSSLPPSAIHADHCHATGTQRGVLCRKCNIAIGLLGDDPQRLRKAADYLERPPLRHIIDTPDPVVTHLFNNGWVTY